MFRTLKVWLIVIAALPPFLFAGPVVAIVSHEDPDEVEQTYSEISLFHYFSDIMDCVIRLQPEDAAVQTAKIPFANIPEEIEDPTIEFATSTADAARLLADIYDTWAIERQLQEQYRRDEAAKLAENLPQKIFEARVRLNRMDEAVRATGEKTGAVLAGSGLHDAYEEVLQKIDTISKMLQRVIDFHNTSESPGQLQATKLALKLEKTTVFIGDSIDFIGTLSCGGSPLSGRDVSLLLDNSEYGLTFRTDSLGHFRGAVYIPFRYSSQLQVQALYVPVDDDSGLYLGSMSAAVFLNVLYYETALDLKADGPVYPGREAIVSGKFDYGNSPRPEMRAVNMYFNGSPAVKAVSGPEFDIKLDIDPQTAPGIYPLTVSVPAYGRYSPLVATFPLEVALIAPEIEVNLPSTIIFPGTAVVTGRSYSSLGPLPGAKIEITSGNCQAEAITSATGDFSARLRLATWSSLFGEDEVTFRVLAPEPWYGRVSASRNIFVINALNCGILLALLVVLVIFLPRLLLRRLGGLPGRSSKPAAITKPLPAPEHSPAVVSKMDFKPKEEPEISLVQLYRRALEIVKKLTASTLLPHQTLREFAGSHSGIPGKAGEYLLELTGLVEKILYAPYRATPEDEAKGREILQNIEQETGHENR